MSDSNYMESGQITGGGGWQSIKLRDLGDGTFGIVQMDVGAWTPVHINSATTTTLKSGPGVLGGVVVNKANSLSTITIYDNTAGSGSVVGVMTHPLTLLASQYFLEFKCKFTTGLTIVTSANDDLTVMYM